MNETNQEILSLDDIYFKDAFTKTEDKLNLDVDNANIKCLTSKDNKFSLDNNGNLVVNSITTNSINAQNILDMIYPIGSIYSSRQNVNPSTLFGGVWSQIEGKFLLGCDDTHMAGTTGGEAAHKLTINEMPSHEHPVVYTNNGKQINLDGNGSTYKLSYGTNGYNGNGITAKAVGGNKPHNNMPPYIAVYIWERIA